MAAHFYEVTLIMATIFLTSGKSFSSESNETLLDAAARANVVLPYSCRTGRCSTCKSKVVDGVTTATKPELGLTAGEKADGWILSCVRTATTDVRLDADDLGDLSLPAQKTLPCRVAAIHKLGVDIVRVVLRMPPTAQFAFLPGQYVNMIGPGGVRRSYSIAGSDALAKTIELHIRAVDGGEMSHYWFDVAKEGDLLRLNGPLGTFFLHNIGKLDLVFLATGTGIAPVKAMLDSLALRPEADRPRSVSV